MIIGVSTGGVYHVQVESEDCLYVGDLNTDGSYNILDIVSLANCVLAANCSD